MPYRIIHIVSFISKMCLCDAFMEYENTYKNNVNKRAFERKQLCSEKIVFLLFSAVMQSRGLKLCTRCFVRRTFCYKIYKVRHEFDVKYHFPELYTAPVTNMAYKVWCRLTEPNLTEITYVIQRRRFGSVSNFFPPPQEQAKQLTVGSIETHKPTCRNTVQTDLRLGGSVAFGP
jgi:hypothetical protein